ncbi:MAG: N-acetylglucosamine-6-phosphate deacetylase [Verrucomicrobiaceae bacterium]|nr:MAG: N-acetylglucosamine-6-phosphate deacetylase [Verrucomicrobiaceae bacterium]
MNTNTLDLQVNGFAGVDFNRDDLTAESLRHACVAAREAGADRIFATVITDSVEAMARRLSRLAVLRETDEAVSGVIAGLHVEGPFLNPAPGYIGAHPVEHARLADLESARRLIDAGQGLVRLVTLAPECDPGLMVTRWLAGRGIVVSAGHCDTPLDTLKAAADAGLSMFTHVGNGCPQLMHRHDNIIQRALSLADRLWLCFVVDGTHVPPVALGNYWRAAGLDRVIAVTDAISAAGLGPGRFTLGNQVLEIGEDLIAWGPGRAHFAGSTATMRRVQETAAAMGLTPEEIVRITSVNPRRAMGMR